MTVNANLDLILRRHEELGARLSAGVAGADYAKLSRELVELEPIAAAIKTLRAKERERAELDALLADPSLDTEMREMAEVELQAAVAAAATLAQAIRFSLLLKNAGDDCNLILEILNSTGGDEV